MFSKLKLWRESSVKKLLSEALGKPPLAEIKSLLDELKDLVGPDITPLLKKNILLLKDEIAELEITKKTELKEIKLANDINDRDLKHLIKIKEESVKLESEKNAVQLAKDFNQKEMVLQKDYFEKSIGQLEVARTEMKEVYEKIMKCLPNINWEISRERSKE